MKNAAISQFCGCVSFEIWRLVLLDNRINKINILATSTFIFI